MSTPLIRRCSSFTRNVACASRSFASAAPSSSSKTQTNQKLSADSFVSPNTHFKITTLRSAIALGSKKKGTLVALGLHRRMQTVFHPHTPDIAGKILAVKELVKVENVPAEAVRTKTEQRRERKASRGFVVISGVKDRDVDGWRSQSTNTVSFDIKIN